MVVISTTNPSLGSTARWTACARAYESKREDHLFEDPWASALAGIKGAAWAATRPPDSLVPMILRTRYFDDFLQRVTSEDEIRQVILMAAGLDTRAYRLVWPDGTIVFKLNQPAVLQEKRKGSSFLRCTTQLRTEGPRRGPDRDLEKDAYQSWFLTKGTGRVATRSFSILNYQ